MPESSALPTPSRRPFVLVADDNLDVLVFVSHVLSSFCEVATVADGEEAWQAISVRMPDLLLTDVAMPKLDGLALLDRVRAAEQTRGLVVVVHSSMSGDELRLRGRPHEPDAYLHKPLTPLSLITGVKEQLSRRQCARVPRT